MLPNVCGELLIAENVGVVQGAGKTEDYLKKSVF